MLRYTWPALFLLLGAGISAEPPRNDTAGAPLPHGAVARLGSLRFQDGGDRIATALSPDGGTWASVDFRKTIRLWDTATGRERRTLGPILEYVSPIQFSPDGRLLAGVVWSVPESVVLWDVATGKERRRFTPGTGISSPVFSADSRFVAVSYSAEEKSANVLVYEWATARTFGPFHLMADTDIGLAFPPDGRLLAAWGRADFKRESDVRYKVERTVQLWDVRGGTEQNRVFVADSEPRSVVFSPDGRTLAANTVSSVSLWESNTGRFRLAFQGPSRQSGPVKFAPDGRTLFSVAGDLVHHWDAANGAHLGVRRCPWSEQTQLGFTPRFWSEQTQLGFTPQGRLLAWRKDQEDVPQVFDVDAGRLLTPPIARRGTVRGLRFLDNAALSVVSGDGHLETWEAARATLRRRQYLEDTAGYDFDRAGAAALTPDGKQVVAYDGSSLRMWDRDSGIEIRAFSYSSRCGDRVTLSADGTRVAAGDYGQAPPGAAVANEQGNIDVWDLATGNLAGILPARAVETVTAFTLTPDGKQLVYSGEDAVGNQVLSFWDVGAEGVSRTLLMPTRIEALAFAPDGKTLAAVESCGGISQWEVESGRFLRRLEGYAGFAVAPLAFSADGRFLACAGDPGDGSDQVVLLWDTASGELRRQWSGHRGKVTYLGFSPDGKQLASGGSDTTILLWDLKR
jgi:WD40 repeat protein